ncbi:sensor histidine kinase, partial [Rhodoplanes sp. SY1]|uniref:sensor histidine kinase n=1 Tax=Rhodoplanes sp. SY1 TaxID=3166646 RepID=UPI0038B61D0D
AFAGLLGETIRRTADTRLHAMVGGIESSSRRLRNLINDLAEFSRLGRHAQPLAPVALDEVVQEAMDDMRQRILETGATVTCGALPTVQCDRNQMRQVLQNLLSNALKYRDPARPCAIRIEARVETAGQHAEPTGFVHVLVADNGIGFDPKYAEQVFEPFQRLHGPDEYEGSGIG